MATSQSLSEQLNAARDISKSAQENISNILNIAKIQDLSDQQAIELAAETTRIEAAAIDIFAVFEARMQHHFKRGPFSRKLKAALLAAGHPDLADRLHQHYLAINVLKHGTGASYRELLNNKSTLFAVKPVNAGGTDNTTGLIDVTLPYFFDRLAETILEASNFLEHR
ncbi:hypothetical protein N9M66_05630 [Litoreibacter sp.]|nr:hypothetical protein [Litoreibacter sp.]